MPILNDSFKVLVMKKHSFIAGTIILSISAIICKILSAVYKIPLANILTPQGMGIYYIVFPIYSLLLALVSSSFTVVVSRNVSSAIAKFDNFLAYNIFKSSMSLQLYLSCGCCIILCAFSKVIARLQGFTNVFFCYLVIAPAIIFVGINSVLKGFFQGLKNMLPSAITQVIDQLFKLGIGFTLATILSRKGAVFGALGAFLGVTIGELITCLFFIFYFFIFKKHNHEFFIFNQRKLNISRLKKKIFKQTIPLTISSIIMPMLLVIDSFLIINILKTMGFNNVFASGLLGLNSGIVSSLIFLPTAVAVSLSMVIIPYISYSATIKDYLSIQFKTGVIFKIVLLVCLPSFFIFTFFSPAIIKLFYNGMFEGVYDFNLTCSLLTISSINILYLSFLQVSTSLLQAISKAYIPVVSLSFALIFKVVFEVFLVSNPYLNITGAVISNSVCYLVSSFINIFYFKKQIRFNFSFKKCFIFPLLLSLGLVIIIFLTYKLLSLFISFLPCAIISTCVGLILYIIFIFVFRIFTKDDYKTIFNYKEQKVN